MPELFTNAAQTTLAQGCAPGDGTVTVTSPAGFPASGTFRVVVDAEVMTVTAVSGTTWTVSRASEVYAGAQVAAQHNARALVSHVLTAGGLAGAFGSAPKTYVNVSDPGALVVEQAGVYGDLFHLDTADGRVGVGTAPVGGQFVTVTGYQPAASGASGVKGPTIVFNGSPGGNYTGTLGGALHHPGSGGSIQVNGGPAGTWTQATGTQDGSLFNGGQVNLLSGPGGAAQSANGTNFNSLSGQVTLATAAGTALGVANTGSNTAGGTGDISQGTGGGGAASGSTTQNVGGVSGNVLQSTGAGGAATSAGTATAQGGLSGRGSWIVGVGGAAVSTGTGNPTGGASNNFSVDVRSGGAASGGTTALGGNSGNITLSIEASGGASGASGLNQSGDAGSITLQAGNSTGVTTTQAGQTAQTGKGGSITLQAGQSGPVFTSGGSTGQQGLDGTVQVYQTTDEFLNQALFMGYGKLLSNGVATALFDLDITGDNAFQFMGSGDLIFTAFAEDNAQTQKQIYRGKVKFAAVSVGGAFTVAGPTEYDTVSVASAGAISTAWTVTTGGSKVTLKLALTSTGLATPALGVVWTLLSSYGNHGSVTQD